MGNVNGLIIHHIPLIQSGVYTYTITGNESDVVNITINFNTSYDDYPVVVATLSDPARGGGAVTPRTAIGVAAVFKDSFRLMLKTSGAVAGNIVIYWVAMPKTQ